MRLSDLPADLLASRANMFAAAALPVSGADLAAMRELIAAVESVVTSPAWRAAHDVAACEAPPFGVFMSFDFHLTAAGPRLIEINCNAAGGLLTALQAGRDDVLAAYVDMFRAECGERPMRSIAIVDETPQQQYFFPEFIAFQQLFAAHGLKAVVCAPQQLQLRDDGLYADDLQIDLVYNRLTDFDLSAAQHAHLRAAWLGGAAILTPHPHLYRLYADKRNLVTLADAAALNDLGVDAATQRILLEYSPRCELVTPERGEYFRDSKKQWFFKPQCGFGGRAAYRGASATRRVMDVVCDGDYIAQQLTPPSTHRVDVNGEALDFKADVRNYVYRGQVQMVAARLYRGQMTNFRVPGGGFARVVDSDGDMTGKTT